MVLWIFVIVMVFISSKKHHDGGHVYLRLKNKVKDLGRLWMKIMDKLATVGVTKR
jgi:hypothetical protein